MIISTSIFESVVSELEIGRDVKELKRRVQELLQRDDVAETDKEALRQFPEDISSGDWTRVGVVLGILWYKLDRLIGNLDDIKRDTRSIAQNTARM